MGLVVQSFAIRAPKGTVSIPAGSSILGVGYRYNAIRIFAMVDENEKKLSERRYVIATENVNLDRLGIAGLSFVGAVDICEETVFIWVEER
jgi:hypothetical protein